MKATLEPPNVVAPEDFKIVPFLPRQRELLLRHWDRSAETLMGRDADNPKFANGGHRIKSNPLLTAAIREIRDRYFTLFNEKCQLLQQQEKAQKIESTNKDWDQRLDDVDYDLIVLNQKSFQRLQQPNYGFNNGQKTDILAATPDPVKDERYQLDKTDAAKIVGTIIKRSINAFEVQFKPRIRVPHVPLQFEPEKSHHFRSKPRPSGRGDTGWQTYVEHDTAEGKPPTGKSVV